MCFLMGLNDSYSRIHGQILLMDPIPSIIKVLSLVVQEVKWKEVDSLSSTSESQLAFAVQNPAARSSNYNHPLC